MYFSRNILRTYFISVFLLVFVLVLPSDAIASTSVGYSIAEIHVRTELNPDGSMDVIEFITYNILPDHDGVIEKAINISRASEIIGLEVSAISKAAEDESAIETEMLPMFQVEAPSNGQTSVFTVDSVDIGYSRFKVLKLFLPTGMKNVTINLRYRLNDIIYLYNDTSLLQWQFVPPTQSNINGRISLEVILPQKILQEDLNAFAHGSIKVEDAVIYDESVIINTTGLIQGESLEAFVLMPIAAISGGRKFVDNYIVTDILALREHSLAQIRQAEFEQEQKIRLITITGLILLIIGLSLGSYFYVSSLKKTSREILSEGALAEVKDSGKLPEHYYTPAELSALVNRSRITSRDLIATLMDLVIKGYLHLTVDISNDYKTLKLELKEDCYISRLEPHEEYLMNWMLRDVATGGVFSTLDIKSAFSNLAIKDKFLSKFDTWTRIVLKQASRWNFEQSFSKKSSKLTPYGLTQYSQWMAFKKFLRNFNCEDEVLTLEDLEKYIVYAVPLGEAQQLASHISTLYDIEAFYNENLTLLKRENLELFESWFDCLWEEL